METIREPAVAGTFYPNDPAALSAMIDNCLEETGPEGKNRATTPPKAIIAPHAGYIYSGEIAGSVYRQVAEAGAQIRRVVLLGPAHRVAFRGMAVPTVKHFRTPLGDIPLSADALEDIIDMPSVGYLDQAHEKEHSLEVHLPFLQQVLGEFELVPVVVGDTSKQEVAKLLERLWGGAETLIVISSDLSHYKSYDEACEIDRLTTQKIVNLDASLQGQEACGCRPVNGLLHYLKQQGLEIETIDVRNSGDTAGDKARVVGDGAWRVTGRPDTGAAWSPQERHKLLTVARGVIQSGLSGEKQFSIDPASCPERLLLKRATFVTLNLNGRLRGCIGTLLAHRPLIVDVAHNAQAAAFRDSRFTPLTSAEFAQVDLHISVLSKPQRMQVESREDLLGKLRPGVDGLIIKEGDRQSTYLPSVWSQMPDAETFVRELRRKGGMNPDTWSEDTRVFHYTTEAFG